MSSDVLRFLLAGVGSNIINFIVYLLLYSAGLSLFISSLAGYSAGLILSYHFGRVWVFGKKFSISKKNLAGFASVYTFSGLGMSSLIEVLDKATRLDYRIIWFFGAIFAVNCNFFGLKLLVFNRSKSNNGK